MLAVTAILSCVIKIRGLFKSTKWRHFENVKFEALSALRATFYCAVSNGIKYYTVLNLADSIGADIKSPLIAQVPMRKRPDS